MQRKQKCGGQKMGLKTFNIIRKLRKYCIHKSRKVCYRKKSDEEEQTSVFVFVF